MATKKKRTKEREEAEAELADLALTVLECGNFRPALKEFFCSGNLAFALRATRESMGVERFYSLLSSMNSPSPCGALLKADSPGNYFRISEAWPLDRGQRDRLSLMWAGMVAAPDHIVKLVVYDVDHQGDSRRVKSGYYYQTPELRGGGWDRHWLGVGSSGIRLRDVHRVTPAGRTGTWQQHAVYKGDVGGVYLTLTTSADAVCRRMWSVVMQCENGRSGVRFLTDESGVTGFYNLRSAPLTPSGRRSPLRHWVREHVRLKPDAAASASRVREHFRGREEFDWFGLRCRVIPPTNKPD